MALLPPSQLANELIEYYYEEIKKECIARPEGDILRLAAKLTIKHADEMIYFIEDQMKGWIDWDMKQHYELVKEYILKNHLNDL
jgi:hypothetical protein